MSVPVDPEVVQVQSLPQGFILVLLFGSVDVLIVPFLVDCCKSDALQGCPERELLVGLDSDMNVLYLDLEIVNYLQDQLLGEPRVLTIILALRTLPLQQGLDQLLSILLYLLLLTLQGISYRLTHPAALGQEIKYHIQPLQVHFYFAGCQIFPRDLQLEFLDRSKGDLDG